MTESDDNSKVRLPAVVGRFYPANGDTLHADVSAYLRESGEAPQPGLRAIMVPHAGYPFSGPTAGHAYARATGRPVKRAFLLGRSHHYRFEGISIPDAEFFRTPLGDLPVDCAALKILGDALGRARPDAHDQEHTLEVQLPFIQVAWGNVPIVPLLLGSDPGEWHTSAGHHLAAIMGEEDLLIISTDLSHFHSEAEANQIDQASLQLVLQQSPEALFQGVQSGACKMCGASAVVAGMAAALDLGARDWSILDYRTSGAASGDFSRVVGYGALSMAHAA